MRKIDKHAIMLEVMANEEIERRFNERIKIPSYIKGGIVNDPPAPSEVRRDGQIKVFNWEIYFIMGIGVGAFLFAVLCLLNGNIKI